MAKIPQFFVGNTILDVERALDGGVINSPSFIFIRDSNNLIFVDVDNNPHTIVGDDTAITRYVDEEISRVSEESDDYALSLFEDIQELIEHIQYEIDEIKSSQPEIHVINSLSDNSVDKPLSAAKGKELYDEINNIKDVMITAEDVTQIINEQLGGLLNGKY